MVEEGDTFGDDGRRGLLCAFYQVCACDAVGSYPTALPRWRYRAAACV